MRESLVCLEPKDECHNLAGNHSKLVFLDKHLSGNVIFYLDSDYPSLLWVASLLNINIFINILHPITYILPSIIIY